MKAKVITVQGKITPNGRARIMRVKAGERGTGQQFGPSVEYWPWSGPSCEQADRIVGEICRLHDLEIVE